MQKPKERTLIGPAEAPSNRATSSRNGGRNHLGTPSDIKSEWWATSSRIRGRLPPESAVQRVESHKNAHRRRAIAHLVSPRAQPAHTIRGGVGELDGEGLTAWPGGMTHQGSSGPA